MGTWTSEQRHVLIFLTTPSLEFNLHYLVCISFASFSRLELTGTISSSVEAWLGLEESLGTCVLGKQCVNSFSFRPALIVESTNKRGLSNHSLFFPRIFLWYFFFSTYLLICCWNFLTLTEPNVNFKLFSKFNNLFSINVLTFRIIFIKFIWRYHFSLAHPDTLTIFPILNHFAFNTETIWQHHFTSNFD